MTGAPAWTDAARALADKVTADAPGWHEAVSNTPRHKLVPRWWQRIPDSIAQEWALVSSPESSAELLRAAYTDETLVTRVGPTHADHAAPGEHGKGDPTSSSTLPGLIVSMAHRLDVKPGQRVLDVGTGSGYSAGLFARRFGDEYVTSVDVDPYLVEAARTRLAEFGRTPRLATVDATEELPDTEYDRIMATVSVRPVPASWLRALRPGGRVVTTVAHTALLITADMGTDGIARGTVQPDPATFMEARRGADYPGKLDDVFVTARVREGEDVRAPEGVIPDLWQEWPLRWLFELDTPGVETRAATYPDDGRRVVWLLAADGSWARAEDGTSPVVHQGGPRRLWDALERVRRRWEENGRFPLHSMRAELSPEGSHLLTPDESWRFPV
ncbi:protein-L-isoaspartate(D-aspartate) O-methyltransferase [Streptomyces venezuelae]|uniref:Protein-L-isoaspartate O-methyltransferase n=1 Tax=Streptomyces venezuelae TaxID=54571 RepID=A0A5P2CHK3_STRVZ|nr:methyltransferase domain-containing protein [Streptomyces venezuelae]QES42332.1 protein-L-isoaspartate(D-aspartate) O-methyltransferase [Streptomyces venezuelae]